MIPLGTKIYHVERAYMRDLPDILAMVEGSAEGPHWPAGAWQRYTREIPDQGPDRVLLLARDGDQVACGWIAGTLLGETAELEFVWVSRSARGAGLGSALLREWIAWASARGATEALLEVRAADIAVLKLYGRSGFVPVGLRRGYYSDPVDDAILMHREV